jgi:hypothetical protein
MPSYDPIPLSEQLIAFVKRSNDPDLRKIALYLQARILGETGLPEPIYDDHINPMWEVPMMVPIHRQDNSLSMTVAAGKLESRSKLANVSHALGGFVYIVSVSNKGKGKKDDSIERYAVNVRPLLEQVIHMDDRLRQVPRKAPKRK